MTDLDLWTWMQQTTHRINAQGNPMTDYRHLELKRDSFDGAWCASAQGWVQYETWSDAPWFGIWLHPARRLVVTFAEGDLSLVSCLDEQGWQKELTSMEAFYGSTPSFDRSKG